MTWKRKLYLKKKNAFCRCRRRFYCTCEFRSSEHLQLPSHDVDNGPMIVYGFTIITVPDISPRTGLHHSYIFSFPALRVKKEVNVHHHRYCLNPVCRFYPTRPHLNIPVIAGRVFFFLACHSLFSSCWCGDCLLYVCIITDVDCLVKS